jgi:multimeric flavodoxin WrbA
MKLTVFDGSPKKTGSNTAMMLDAFAEGFLAVDADAHVLERHKLNAFSNPSAAVPLFDAAEAVLIAYPLYCYAMPGGVMAFFEALEPLLGRCGGKPLFFLVQYGFREACHARPVEKYHKKLAALLGCAYGGTIIKGSCDGLASGMGPQNPGILAGIRELGANLGRTGTLDQQQLDAYSAPEYTEAPEAGQLRRTLAYINENYWGAMLTHNGVSIEESHARPLASSVVS